MLRALIAALGLWLAAAPASAQSLEALFSRMASIEALECHFREEKRIALLSSPIVTEGEIHYLRPGRLARRITAPSPQVILIDGASLSMWDGAREERLDLSSQPVVRSFVDSILALLAGDRAALERSYRLSLTAEGDGYALTLTPRAAPLTEFLASIRFTLSRGYDLVQMQLTETSGDVATTVFSAVDDDRRYTDAERRRIFSLH
jgi:outer membrane lipoprotein-sorting protein